MRPGNGVLLRLRLISCGPFGHPEIPSERIVNRATFLLILQSEAGLERHCAPPIAPAIASAIAKN
jgi:hypothetical protein